MTQMLLNPIAHYCQIYYAETDVTQAELEEIAAGAEAGGAKGRAALRSPRALDLEALTTRHKQHIVRMEQVRLDTDRNLYTC